MLRHDTDVPDFLLHRDKPGTARAFRRDAKLCGIVPEEIRRNYSRETAFCLSGTRKTGVHKMASIIPFLPDGMHLRDSVFEAHEIKAMSAAFGKVCEAMNLQDDCSAKQIIAARIIDLVRRGECSPKRLRDRILQEASLAEAVLKDVSAV